MNEDSHTPADQDDTARFQELSRQVVEAGDLYLRRCEELQVLAKEKATALLSALGEQVREGAFESGGLIQALDVIAEETAALLPEDEQADFRLVYGAVERAFLAFWACAPAEE